MIVCAIHKPTVVFLQGQELKEYISSIVDEQSSTYTVSINPSFIATNDASCGTMQIEVSYNDNALINALKSARKYTQSADKLTHEFTNPWELT